MNRERWQQIDRLFKSALERPSSERETFLDAACAGDAGLRREVESLIVHEQSPGFTETPAVGEPAGALAEERAASLVGRTVGPYRLLGKIGAGGMGEVYRALDVKLGRVVALKWCSLITATGAGDAGRYTAT